MSRDPFTMNVPTAVTQSVIIHPDWNEQDHSDYILSETFNSEIDIMVTEHGSDDAIMAGRLTQCGFPPGCNHAAVTHGKLCFHHLVSVARLMAPAPRR